MLARLGERLIAGNIVHCGNCGTAIGTEAMPLELFVLGEALWAVRN
jgi:hypothetical protein